MGRRASLTAEQKLAIVRQSDRQPAWKQKQLGEWAAAAFQLSVVPSQPTISIVLRQAGRTVKTRERAPKRPKQPKPSPEPKRPKVVHCPQVESALVRWLDAQIEKDAAVSVTAVETQARVLVDKLKVTVDGFVVSDTWVDSFVRHNLLNCPFGLSDSETTDGEEDEEDTLAGKKATKSSRMLVDADIGRKAGKTSRRVAKPLAPPKKDSRTPAPAKSEW
ncbi:DNA-binding centromere protein B (CENP-B) [Phytophthora cinnamomi]|uniref:DNA-binding centromere protein B (CENP-B) n=1 Tax=Phytophthora cinnamomi TaxID=4785 RepID=UPI0035595796|nr:DNA-binding centromere protein B (CENP-B) [Phytophthora cinnamomi]